ncbi:response regulator [bacterium]|nr:response regulator [bacterium]MBU1652413.1 response regulator [bacterium]
MSQNHAKKEIHKPQLLFVDDESNVLKSLKRIFIDDDFEIELIGSGEKALEFIRKQPVDLILSDHNMPGMSGVDFFQAVQEILPDTIRMLITGRGDMEVALEAINRGHIYKYFSKPWDDEALRISILHALEFKRTQEIIRQQEEALARFQSYRQTMVTVSHYINNFNCSLMMSLDATKNLDKLSEKEKDTLEAAFVSSKKISEVLRILNEIQNLRIVDYPHTDGMLDIEQEVEKAIKKIEQEV